MNRICLLSGLLVMFAGATAFAQESLLPPGTELKTEKELEALSEKTLARLIEGDVDAFDELRPHAVESWGQDSSNRFFRSLGERLKDFNRKWGAPLGYRQIARRHAGDSLIQLVYLAKYEKNVLRWAFTYYRPRDTWLFFRLDFDDNVNALFDDAERSGAPPPEDAKP